MAKFPLLEKLEKRREKNRDREGDHLVFEGFNVTLKEGDFSHSHTPPRRRDF